MSGQIQEAEGAVGEPKGLYKRWVLLKPLGSVSGAGSTWGGLERRARRVGGHAGWAGGCWESAGIEGSLPGGQQKTQGCIQMVEGPQKLVPEGQDCSWSPTGRRL